MSDTVRGHNSEFEAALGLSWSGPLCSVALLQRLIEAGPAGVWRAPRRTLSDWGLTDLGIRRFEAARAGFDAAAARTLMGKTRQRFIPYGDIRYPPELCDLRCPPAGMFVLGTDDNLDRFLVAPRIAVVGTRRASSEGMRATSMFAKALSVRGIAIVSGMALGIDSQAHLTSLENGGLTVAVLGCGVDVVYPPRHRALHEQIARSGVVMSELPPGTHPTRWSFPHRNRLLAALGDAVLMTEGGNTSGAVQTARCALDLGRQVFPVPSSIFRESGEGCNSLIHDGAMPALTPEGLLYDFTRMTEYERAGRGGEALSRAVAGEQMALAGFVASGDLQRRVLDALREGPMTVDDVVKSTGLPVRQVSATLGELEVQGGVGRGDPGMYVRSP